MDLECDQPDVNFTFCQVHWVCHFCLEINFAILHCFVNLESIIFWQLFVAIFTILSILGMSLTFVYLCWIIHILCHWWPWKCYINCFQCWKYSNGVWRWQNWFVVSGCHWSKKISEEVISGEHIVSIQLWFSRALCSAMWLFFCIISGAKLTPAGIPLPDALSENRQLSLQIMLISYPFNLSIVQYFS